MHSESGILFPFNDQLAEEVVPFASPLAPVRTQQRAPPGAGRRGEEHRQHNVPKPGSLLPNTFASNQCTNTLLKTRTSNLCTGCLPYSSSGYSPQNANRENLSVIKIRCSLMSSGGCQFRARSCRASEEPCATSGRAARGLGSASAAGLSPSRPAGTSPVYPE